MNVDTKYRKTLLQAYTALKKAEARVQSIEDRDREPVAIIGMSCRFPKAAGIAQFWGRIERGDSSVEEFPRDRWNTDLIYDPDWEKPGKCYVREGAFLDGIDQFDPVFFNISPLEARHMDPQHRLLLESVWETVETAGIPPSSLKGTRTAVFAALSEGTYSASKLEACGVGIDSHFITGNATSTATGRISYLLGLHGPCMAVDAACSSSLVAVALGVQSLRRRESDFALAGGVNLMLNPFGYIGLSKMRALSPDGRCRSYDAAANGYGRGEGCGFVLLKRLSDAIRDADIVMAVIRGSAVNQDGMTNGLTAPNGLYQERVIQAALKEAGISPSQVGYIEGHGTGTPLGDPIELEAVSRAYRPFSPSNHDATLLYIGSVKANIGHLESAAGIAGLIKAVLCLKHNRIPPSPHFATPNPRFDWDRSLIRVPQAVMCWPGNERFAGVSSFGFSGTNVHLVLEAGSDVRESGAPAPPSDNVLLLSAKTEQGLKDVASRYADFLEGTASPLSAICYTALAGRDHFAFRLAVTGKTHGEMAAALSDFAAGITHQRVVTGKASESPLDPGVAPSSPTEIPQRYVSGKPLGLPATQGARCRAMLPTYPFQRKRYWVEESDLYQTMVGKRSAPQPARANRETTPSLPASPVPTLETDVMPLLMSALVNITEMGTDTIDPERNFFELGMDSIMIIRLCQFVSERLGMDIEMGRFFQELDTLRKLSEFLSRSSGSTAVSATGSPVPAFVPFRSIDAQQSSDLDHKQEAHLRDIIHRHNERTSASKAATQEHRLHLANNRNIAGFRPAWKEMTYPLIVDRAAGSQIWDLDGNKFLDFTMGFGTCLFGHKPPFIAEAIKRTIDAGTPLGPMCPFAGRLAEAICGMTGAERVAFYNSGTEAVMVALRLARTATARTKIVMFAGSYHGTFDGILAKEDSASTGSALPLAPGIPADMVTDVYVLPYGEAASLDFIRRHATELAGVLVEPVQSRRPDLQPVDFLAALRDITQQAGATLIFDEVITGFRCAPGGAQEWFGIRADLATYGKVIGGGLPIGIVGGKAEFMDGVDGGMWRYGDASFPGKRTTFVSGTFCHHPLAMTAGLAVIDHLREHPQLQAKLTTRTSDLCERLNSWFAEQRLPIRMVQFSSLFRFVLKGNQELLFPHLLNKGIYVWEGRNCFLSTAHTDADVDFLVNAVQSSVGELVDAGYVSPAKSAQRFSVVPRSPELFPATPAQRSIWLAQNLQPESAHFNLSETFVIQGALDTVAFAEAVQRAVLQHESLRTAIVAQEGRPSQKVVDDPGFHLRTVDWLAYDAGQIECALASEIGELFRMDQPPLIRALLFARSDGSYGFTLTVHHIVCDGWSMDILFEDILAHYLNCTSPKPRQITVPAFQYRDFCAWQEKFLAGSDGQRVKDYWLRKLDGWRATEISPDIAGAGSQSQHEEVVPIGFDAARKERLARLQVQTGTTPFMMLAALAQVVVFKRLQQDDMLMGSPVAGRFLSELDRQVGLYINLLPLRTRVQRDASFLAFLATLKQTMIEAYDHEQYPYALLLDEIKPGRAERRHPLFNIEIAFENFNVNHARRSLDDVSLQITPYGRHYSVDRRKFDIEFRFIEHPQSIDLNLVYDPSLYRASTIKSLANDLENLAEAVTQNPERTIADLCAHLESVQRAAVSEKSKVRRKENLDRLSSFKIS